MISFLFIFGSLWAYSVSIGAQLTVTIINCDVYYEEFPWEYLHMIWDFNFI